MCHLIVNYFKTSHFKRTYYFWSSRGVNGPTPWPFFGNLFALMFRSPVTVDAENCKKYGPIYGTYEGAVPVLVVSDRAAVKQVLFTKFQDFSMQAIGNSEDPLDQSMVVNVNGERWKRIRSVISSAFTGYKMKQMSTIIKPCRTRLLKQLAEKARTGQEFQVNLLTSRHVTDISAKAFFSLDMDLYAESGKEFMSHTSKSFDVDIFSLFMMNNFPHWFVKLFDIGFTSMSSRNYLVSMVETVRKSRQKKKESKVDMFQVLLDAHDDNPNVSGKGLSHIEQTGNGFLFFTGASDTAISTLAVIIWLMALHPDIQQKVYQEIVDADLADLTREPLYDDLTQFKYLEAVIYEALRLNPIFQRVSRMTTADTMITRDDGPDIILPKGTHVQLAVHVVHKNPLVYPEPEQFRPERFLSENKNSMEPSDNLTFGGGPRMCPGIRFAFMGMRLTLIELIRRHLIVKSPKTIPELLFRKNQFKLKVDGLFVRLENRQ